MTTHNTREEIEEIEHQAKKHIASLLGYLQQIHDSGQYRCAEIELEKVLENVELLTKIHHHQLQKAREEAVSKERGRIEIELMSTESHSHPGEPGLFKAWSDIRKVINKNV